MGGSSSTKIVGKFMEIQKLASKDSFSPTTVVECKKGWEKRIIAISYFLDLNWNAVISSQKFQASFLTICTPDNVIKVV